MGTILCEGVFVFFSSQSAHNSTLSSFERCWNFLVFRCSVFLTLLTELLGEQNEEKLLQFRIPLLFPVGVKVTLTKQNA